MHSLKRLVSNILCTARYANYELHCIHALFCSVREVMSPCVLNWTQAVTPPRHLAEKVVATFQSTLETRNAACAVWYVRHDVWVIISPTANPAAMAICRCRFAWPDSPPIDPVRDLQHPTLERELIFTYIALPLSICLRDPSS